MICPGIDPLAAKNRDLSLHETVDILCRAALIPCPGPTVQGPYHALARRALPDGTFAPANVGEDIGLLSRPIVTQISRWDRLKGFLPLLRGFVRLKQAGPLAPESTNASERRRLDLVRLVLAGPDPIGVADDPEAADVLNEILAEYASLHRALQDDIALIVLPMESVEENALMVNALQRASTIAIQNSLREGFGLTIAEAMWKRIPVLSNSRACGPRQQVRDGVDGRLVRDPENVEELERAIREMLAAPDRLVQMGRAGQRRVHDGLLVLAQLRSWGRLLGATLEARLLTGPPV